ncbi:hypothetical protein [Williamwhitmania taraxaci]|nr:hypothetical protein [Williamwhitmania taraxaci]
MNFIINFVALTEKAHIKTNDIMLENIGYIAPEIKEIEFFHKEIYKILGEKVTDLLKIIGACFCTMDDKNGESIGLFVALPNKFLYIAGVPEKEHMICEEFPFNKISGFTTKADKKKVHSIIFQIYNQQVIVRGFDGRIPDIFINNLKESRILLFELISN